MFMRGRLVITVDNFNGALLDEEDRSLAVIFSLSGDAPKGFKQMCLKGLRRFFLFFLQLLDLRERNRARDVNSGTDEMMTEYSPLPTCSPWTSRCLPYRYPSTKFEQVRAFVNRTNNTRRTDRSFPKRGVNEEIFSHRPKALEIFSLERGRWFWLIAMCHLKIATKRHIFLGVCGIEIPDGLFL
jgi:hypothetical protein